MPPDPLDRLTTLAQAVLDTTVTILETTDEGPPASQYLSPARPAFDCEFVAVQIARLAEDVTSPLGVTATKRRNVFGNIIIVTFILYVVRCGPVLPRDGSPPTDAAKTASAGIVQQDGWAIWNGIRDAQDELFDNCLGVYFDGGIPIPEQGGFVGWQFQIRASIEGFVP